MCARHPALNEGNETNGSSTFPSWLVECLELTGRGFDWIRTDSDDAHSLLVCAKYAQIRRILTATLKIFNSPLDRDGHLLLLPGTSTGNLR